MNIQGLFFLEIHYHTLITFPCQVKPWLQKASASMLETQLFSELTCESTQQLAKLQDYKPLKTLIGSSSSLTKVLVSIKSKDAGGTSASLHTSLDKFASSVNKFKDYRSDEHCVKLYYISLSYDIIITIIDIDIDIMTIYNIYDFLMIIDTYIYIYIHILYHIILDL